MDLVFVFITADPSWSGTKYWWLVCIFLFNDVISSGAWVKDLEVLRRSKVWLLTVSDLVKVVVNNFAKIDEHVLLDLNFSVLVDLYSRGVDDAEITDIVPSIFANNHQLGLP